MISKAPPHVYSAYLWFSCVYFLSSFFSPMIRRKCFESSGRDFSVSVPEQLLRLRDVLCGQELAERHVHCLRNRACRFEIIQGQRVRDDVRSTELGSRADLKFALPVPVFTCLVCSFTSHQIFQDLGVALMRIRRALCYCHTVA